MFFYCCFILQFPNDMVCEHFFMCLFTICVSCGLNFHFITFAHFLKKFFWGVVFEFLEVLYHSSTKIILVVFVVVLRRGAVL